MLNSLLFGFNRKPAEAFTKRRAEEERQIEEDASKLLAF